MIVFPVGGSSSQHPPTECNKDLEEASNITGDPSDKEEPAKIFEGSG